MKPEFCRFLLQSSFAIALLASPAAQAATYYWDYSLPLETPGFDFAGGTWGSDPYWSASVTGEDPAGIVSPLITDDLNFGTVANVLGAGTLTVTDTQSAKSLTFALGSGAIVLSGGTLDLAAAATINVDNTAGASITSTLTGAATSLIKTGSGPLTLSGSNSYHGTTLVNSVGAAANSVLTVANNNALGTTTGGTTLLGSNVTSNGSQLNLATGITVTDETLTLDSTENGYRSSLVTSGTATWDGNVVLTGTGGLLAFVSNASSNLTVGSSPADTVTGSSNTLVVRGNGVGTIHSTISAAGLSKTDGGTWTLTAPNTYAGPTVIGSTGGLSINSIKNVGGGASALGAPTTVENGTIQMGDVTNTNKLTYTGTGDTTDRVINLRGTSGGAILDQSGASGLLKFTSDFTATGVGGKTLTLQGATAATGEMSGAIVNNGSVTTKTLAVAFATNVGTITLDDVTGITVGSRIAGTGLATAATITAINTSTKVVTLSNNTTGAGTVGQTLTITASTNVTKTGAGVWTLSGTNTYTGTTRIDGGVLRIDNPNASPGGIGATGGTSYLLFNNGGILGLGGTGPQPDFTRPHGAGRADGFYFQSNGGFAAYDQDRVVNVGGANAQTTWLNGKTIILGHSTATHKVRISNPFNITTVTRPLQVNDGLAVVDGELSGVISHNAGAFAGVDKTGTGTVAFTGNSTFTGSLVVRSGIVVVNKVTNTGTASPIGQGASGFTLAGGTFQYAPVDGVGGEAATINRTFAIPASSSLDASGTGPLVLDNTGVISPDDSGQTGTWDVGANKNITGLASTANLAIGMRISGAGIPAGAVISQILSSSSVTISGTTTAAGAAAPVSFGYPTDRTLTLTGTNTDANTIAGVLQDSSALGAGVLSVTKTGVGSWTLSGSNTYTGPTAINGGTLVITGATQGTSAITFGGGVLCLDVASPVTAANATIDFTGQSVLVSGSPTLASYTLLTAGTITGTAPTLAAPAPAGYALQVVGNELRLVKSSLTGYALWASTNAPTGDPDDDYDGDGVSNAIESVLGGLATTKDLGKLPVPNASGSSLTFSFIRNRSSIDPKTAVSIEVGTTLAAWPESYAVPAAPTAGPPVTVVDNLDGTDTVTVTVDKAANAEKFARIKVVITP